MCVHSIFVNIFWVHIDIFRITLRLVHNIYHIGETPKEFTYKALTVILCSVISLSGVRCILERLKNVVPEIIEITFPIYMHETFYSNI
jgi:hypothetical protein